MALVLCTGEDRTLIETRKLIVERAGHEVMTALNEFAVESACANHAFDVVVIGQSVSKHNKRRIYEAVRKHCPNAKVLELMRHYEGKSLPDADGWLAVPAEVPAELGEKVTALIRAAKTQT